MLPDLSAGNFEEADRFLSQCTYRCVVLPDSTPATALVLGVTSQCTYRCVVLPDSTTLLSAASLRLSQCTYRCVVLPDKIKIKIDAKIVVVSMHLQVRGAP